MSPLGRVHTRTGRGWLQGRSHRSDLLGEFTRYDIVQGRQLIGDGDPDEGGVAAEALMRQDVAHGGVAGPIDLRMGCDEGGQARHQPARGEGGRGAPEQRAGGILALRRRKRTLGARPRGSPRTPLKHWAAAR